MQHIIYRAKIHWISYVKPIAFMIIGLPFLLTLFFIKGFVYLFFCTLLGFLFFKGLYKIWYLKKIRIALIPQFLSLRTGVLSTQMSDIALSKMEGMGLHQSFLGQILNYGTLVVSTGEVTQSYFIKNPMELREQLLQETSKSTL